MNNTQTSVRSLSKAGETGVVGKAGAKGKALRAHVLENFSLFLKQEMEKRNQGDEADEGSVPGQKDFFEKLSGMMLQDADMIRLLSHHHEMKKMLISLISKFRKEIEISDHIPYTREMRASPAFKAAGADLYAAHQVYYHDPQGSQFTGEL